MALPYLKKKTPQSPNSIYSGEIYDLSKTLSGFYVSEAALYLEFPAFNPFLVATPPRTAYFWQGGDENMGEAGWDGLWASRGCLGSSDKGVLDIPFGTLK